MPLFENRGFKVYFSHSLSSTLGSFFFFFCYRFILTVLINGSRLLITLLLLFMRFQEHVCLEVITLIDLHFPINGIKDQREKKSHRVRFRLVIYYLLLFFVRRFYITNAYYNSWSVIGAYYIIFPFFFGGGEQF